MYLFTGSVYMCVLVLYAKNLIKVMCSQYKKRKKNQLIFTRLKKK